MGLWMISSNGCIDILSKRGVISLTDKAEEFQSPKWISYGIKNSHKGKIFKKNDLFKLLGVKENEHL